MSALAPPPLRVAFDSRAAGEPGGVGRYTGCLLEALKTLPAGGPDVVESHRPRRVDVFHSPSMEGALLRSPCPMVVTLHDLVPLKRPGEYLRTGLRFRLRYLAIQRADVVIVPTAAVARDAIEHLGLEPGRVAVIGEAAAPTMYPRSVPQVEKVRYRFGLPERYLLWVGSMHHPQPRKRVAELASTNRNLPLVLAGPTRQWARELPDVLLTGRVSDEDLASIYSGAHALVVPSDDEGFGLPPVESLACGTPVVACDVPAMREVLGDRATFVEQGDYEGLMQAAEDSVGPAPAPPRWSWDDAARATWRVYESVVAKKSPTSGSLAPMPKTVRMHPTTQT